MRKEPFLIGKYYHIYNRGTDKRIIFSDVFDLQRFIQSMEEFNVVDPTGGIYNNKFKNREKFRISSPKLVDFVCYCLNPNHYHFILSPLVDNGIEKFMQKLGAGYTKYFNEKYQRSGVLFQGRYKSIYISSDKYLMYLSAYINLNDHIHRLRPWRSKSMDKGVKLFWKSSWGEYLGKKKENFCNKSIILDRYKDVN
ncbi:MAG: transposase, partial [Patescibacteria group bacterium]|nr:transposase [Patescibacteria group bacterium]